MPYNCVPHKQASSGTSHHTTIKHISRQDVYFSTCEIPTRRIPASFMGNLLLWIASVCFHLLTCTFRSRELSFPPFQYFLRVDIEGLVLGWIERPIFMVWALEWNLLSRSNLRGFLLLLEKTGRDKLTGPFQIYHNPKSSLSSGYSLRSL